MNSAEARSQKIKVQDLFQKMADHPSCGTSGDLEIRLLKWYKDGSALIEVGEPQVSVGRARLSLVNVLLTHGPKCGERPNLARVQGMSASHRKVGPDILVSPVASAVLAVIMR